METIDTIQRISEDFEEGNEPFEDAEFPEERLLRQMPHYTMEDRASLVSAFATFDYNRDASRLVDNIIELYNTGNSSIYDTAIIAKSDEEELADRMSDIGFRYPTRDAHAWHRNCEIVRENYSSRWTDLLLSVSADAPSLVERLREDDFLCIKGDKIAPMYARIIDDEVAPLSNVWELDIPVDTWVRKISKEIFQEDLSDDEIRQRWRNISNETGVERHVVDGGIWQLGNNLDEWGGDYLKEVLEVDGFKYL